MRMPADDPITSRAMRTGYGFMPRERGEVCAECGRALSFEARGLCYVCEGEALDLLEEFLRSFSEVQLECLDSFVEGASLHDIARGR